jgi:hypothetical protein
MRKHVKNNIKDDVDNDDDNNCNENQISKTSEDGNSSDDSNTHFSQSSSYDSNNDGDKLKKFMRKNIGTVEHWDTLPSNKLSEIEAISRKQQKSEQKLLGSRQISEWDKTLDKGRTKKIKVKAEEEIEDDRVNPFQLAIETRKREDTYSDSRMKKRRR